MGKHTDSIDRKILSRIAGKGRGWVFTQADFLDLGRPAAVRQALSRNARGGAIRKIARGLYDYPRKDRRLGILAASTDEIMKALQNQEGSRLQPSGGNAANILGLSEQVPVRSVFLTDGRSRTIKLGQRTIVIKKTTTRQMATAGRISGTVIQALRWLGRHNVDDKVISILSRRLPPSAKRQLLRDLRYAPVWVEEAMSRVARGGHE